MHHVPRYPRLPRIVSLAFGDAAPAEEATHLELVRSFSDNASSPRQGRAFRYGGDGTAVRGHRPQSAHPSQPGWFVRRRGSEPSAFIL